ncbi:MAG: Na+/H+ antiporter NhaC family protein, partial [Bacteroidales bacterium]|nr:Na+/H+ antiporter NhaC family protein [Candidatus Sodaliphilus fimicaballi]
MEKTKTTQEHVSHKQGIIALSPIVVFLLMYVVVSVIIGDFYKMPLSIAFIVASAWALITTRGGKVQERVEIFSKGAANPNVLYMIWIFILAGAFSGLAKGIGAVDATVELTLNWLPGWFVIPGLFLVTCFISMSIGTSVGTIVALTPFAVELATASGGSVAFYVSVVLGGSFFGDNLSFISDTTIAATRSQGVKMNEKFKTNLRIALPAALITLVVYSIQSSTGENMATPAATHPWQLIIPYLIVIVTAASGINVLIVLSLGILSSMILDFFYQGNAIMSLCSPMGEGITGMSDLIIVTLLAAGLLKVI